MNLTFLYVAVLYAIAVWLVRHARVDLPRGVAVLFYALVLVFLWRPMTQDVSLVATDVIKLTPPWSEVRAPNRPPVTKYDVSNTNIHDVPMQIVPWMHQVRESWRAFEVPLWNAAAGAGHPLLANGQSTPLSPLRLLTLPLPLDRAMTAECAMRLLLALVLTYLFCRTRYSPLASVLAAIAFGFSTWMTTWLQFPIATGAAFLPGVLLVIDRLMDGVTRPRFLAATLMFAVAVLSSHPETIYHVALIAAAYGFWLGLVERVGSRRRLGAIACAAGVAALLTSPFLVPFAEAVLRSQRFAEMSGPRETIVPPYSDFPSAILLLQPRFFGELPIERPWGPTTLESVCGFAGILAIVAAIAAAISIVLRRRWRDRETLYVLGVVFSVGVVLGWPVITEVFHAIAGLAPTMRMRLGICWFGSVLIAAVIDDARRHSRLPLLLGTLVVAAGMLALMRTTAFPTPSHRDTALLSLLPSIAVLAAVALLPVRRIALVLLAALMFCELAMTLGRWNPVLMPREFYRPTPLIAAMQQIQKSETAPFRILGVGGMLYPNAGAMFGLEDVRVHDPMADARYVDFLAEQVSWNSKEYYAKWNDTATPVLDFLNVKYVLTTSAIDDARYEPLYTGRDGRIYANRNALPRFFPVRNVLMGGDLRAHTDWRYTAVVSRMPRAHVDALIAPWTVQDATISIDRTAVDAYKLRIAAPRTTLIVSSIPNWPGWRVPFPKVEVNGLFLGFVVPAGTHEVKVAYRPMSFYASSAVALLTLATLLALCRRRRADLLR
ncbi:MAG: YfhO family protein [Acidobacteriota bacterium]|nr:YfhO family protein [Acidobacteriota bacterium]